MDKDLLPGRIEDLSEIKGYLKSLQESYDLDKERINNYCRSLNSNIILFSDELKDE